MSYFVKFFIFLKISYYTLKQEHNLQLFTIKRPVLSGQAAYFINLLITDYFLKPKHIIRSVKLNAAAGEMTNSLKAPVLVKHHA